MLDHPGAVLRTGLELEGRTIKSVSSQLNITRSTLSRICSSKARITPEIAVKLGTISIITGSEWYRIMCDYEYQEASK